MINLEICALCHKRYSSDTFDLERELREAKRTRILACPVGIQGYYEATTQIDGEVPCNCPFITEQVITSAV